MKNDNTLLHKVCCVCGGHKFERLYSAGPLDYSLGTKFPIMECMTCRNYAFTLIDNLENEISDNLYDSGNYDANENAVRRVVRPLLDYRERRKANWLLKLTKGRRLLEVGCGKGRFLLAARQAGFDVVGIEPSSRSHYFAKQSLGDVVYKCDLEVFSKDHSNSFDVIVLWHVFEHIADPITTLDLLRNLLVDGGVLVVAVPNWASIQAHLGKENWYHLDPPRHLHHFTPAGLSLLLTDNGLRNVSINYHEYYEDFVGIVVTILNVLSAHKNVLMNNMKNNDYYKANYSALSRCLFLIYNLIVLILMAMPIAALFILGRLGKSGTFSIIGSKFNPSEAVE